MREETTEHVGQSVKVFLWLILPLSLVYVFGQLFFFAENVFGPMLWSILIYFYGNFLPDLPSIHRKKESELGTTDLRALAIQMFDMFQPCRARGRR